MTLFEERQKRFDDAVALSEPDRVPISASGQCYPIYNAGYSIADVTYDFDKYAQAVINYTLQYEPDNASAAISIPGQGSILELMQPKNLVWPGAPDGRIGKNSLQQFIEYPVLQEEDMDFFMSDYTGWLLTKGYPAVYRLLEPLAGWGINSTAISIYDYGLFNLFSEPAVKKMMQTIWKVTDMLDSLNNKFSELNKRFEDLGFPVTTGGTALVPFDTYSDFYRGTLDTMMDLYEHPGVISGFIERNIEQVLENITMLSMQTPGKCLFIPLHKGMDGLLTERQYRDYYWKYLQRMINHIIDVGMTPFVYTEGPYNSRIKHLTEVPKGKVIYSFEEVDPVYAKQQLGDTACILGAFPVYLLHYGTKAQVIDEVKRLIDILAPGGGYIFATGAGYDQAKPENVEAMFDTVKNYGKR